MNGKKTVITKFNLIFQNTFIQPLNIIDNGFRPQHISAIMNSRLNCCSFDLTVPPKPPRKAKKRKIKEPPPGEEMLKVIKTEIM